MLDAYSDRRVRELRETGEVAAVATHAPEQLKTLVPPKPQVERDRPSAIDELWERKRRQREEHGDGQT